MHKLPKTTFWVAYANFTGNMLRTIPKVMGMRAEYCFESFRKHREFACCTANSDRRGTHAKFSQNRGNVSETPTPTTCLKSTAVHLQFVRQYAPHLYRRTFLASKLRRKGNLAIRLPFVLQYASHLYGSTPPICTAVLLEKYWGLGSPERSRTI